jgi:Lipocalin-like domain
MRRLVAFLVSTIVFPSLSIGLLASDAIGQMAKEQLVGSWTLVSTINTDKSGKKVELFGPNPKGALMFDSTGHFSILITRPDLPKFASRNRMAGTPKENKAVVAGSIAYFGTYSVSDADRTINIHVEGSTFPNWTGTDQKRPFTLTGDELRYMNPTPSVGYGTTEVVWRRAKSV